METTERKFSDFEMQVIPCFTCKMMETRVWPDKKGMRGQWTILLFSGNMKRQTDSDVQIRKDRG